MSHTNSTVMIAKAEHRDLINGMLDSLKAFGPDSLSVPLYDALGVVTHYAYRADQVDNFQQDWAAITTEAQQNGLITPQQRNAINAETIIDVVVDVRATSSPREQFDAAIAAAGLHLTDPTADLTQQ